MWKELQEWLKQDLTIQELKAKAKELGLSVRKQMTKADVRRLLERYIERAKLSEPESVESISSATSQMQESTDQSQQLPPKEDITIPDSYKKDKLVAMPINPQWMYFYWDLSDANASLIKSSNISKVVLRVYDITYIEFNGTNAHRTFEIGIDVLGIRNYYLNVPVPGAHYLGEIGYYDVDGRYIPLLRSNLCMMPTSSPSQSTRERWLDLRKHRRIVMPASGMLTPVIERVAGSVQGLESLFRTSNAGSFSFARLSGKGMYICHADR